MLVGYLHSTRRSSESYQLIDECTIILYYEFLELVGRCFLVSSDLEIMPLVLRNVLGSFIVRCEVRLRESMDVVRSYFSPLRLIVNKYP